jgi:hypothetical protein
MRKLIILVSLTTLYINVAAQWQVGFFGGVTNYQGDLVDKFYVSRFTRPALGVTANYEFSERLIGRAGFTYGKVSGDDQFNNTKDYLKLRNLSFESSILEFSLLAEYNVFNLSNIRWTPYVFGGLAIYRFNPYTYDSQNNKVFLKPLSTEGQGIDGHNAKPYSLTQLALPLGGGIKYAINDRVTLGLEAGVRKLFTDYLDDVSTNYADAAALLAAKGQQAVDLAYRGDEVAGGDPNYPTKGSQRGGAEEKDWYYFTGLHITFRLPSSGERKNFSWMNGGRRGYGCPASPL